MTSGPENETHAHIDAAELFRRHAPFIAAFVARLGFSASDVEDVVQEVFLVAHRCGGYHPGPAKPTTWLSEIAVRTSLAHHRKRRSAPQPSDQLDAVVGAGNPLDSAVQTESLRLLQRAMDGLPIEQRVVFVLFELEGQSCAEIAEACAVPIGTVYSRLHQARQQVLHTYNALRTGPSASATAQQGGGGL